LWWRRNGMALKAIRALRLSISYALSILFAQYERQSIRLRLNSEAFTLVFLEISGQALAACS